MTRDPYEWRDPFEADEVLAYAVKLMGENPVPDRAANTYRGGFDVGYGLACEHIGKRAAARLKGEWKPR